MNTDNSSGDDAADKPDCLDIDTDNLPEFPFPVSVRPEYRVYFEETAYRSMMAHAKTTCEVELGGVLVGDVLCDAHGPYLKIVGSIPAEAAKNRNTQMTFTHETWEYINSVRDATYPDHALVGWYHTHPGFGVFLSEMDMFIQKNFFNQPFQIAVVIDNKAHQEGCFVWKAGEPTPLSKYWVGTSIIALCGASPSDDARDAADESAGTGDISMDARPRTFSELLVLPTLLLCLLVVLYTAFQVSKVFTAHREMHHAVLWNLMQSNAHALREHETTSAELAAISTLIETTGQTSRQDIASINSKIAGVIEEVKRNEAAAAEFRETIHNELAAVMEFMENSLADGQASLVQRLDALRESLDEITAHNQANRALLREFFLLIESSPPEDSAEILKRIRHLIETFGLRPSQNLLPDEGHAPREFKQEGLDRDDMQHKPQE